VARVVAELYRIENVIFVRIKAVGDSWAGPTARLLHYPQAARLSKALEEEPVDIGTESRLLAYDRPIDPLA